MNKTVIHKTIPAPSVASGIISLAFGAGHENQVIFTDLQEFDKWIAMLLAARRQAFHTTSIGDLFDVRDML